MAANTSRSPYRRRPPPCGRDGADGTTRWNNSRRTVRQPAPGQHTRYRTCPRLRPGDHQDQDEDGKTARAETAHATTTGPHQPQPQPQPQPEVCPDRQHGRSPPGAPAGGGRNGPPSQRAAGRERRPRRGAPRPSAGLPPLKPRLPEPATAPAPTDREPATPARAPANLPAQPAVEPGDQAKAAPNGGGRRSPGPTTGSPPTKAADRVQHPRRH